MKEIIQQLATHDLLQDIIEGVPIRIFWKDRECRYLGCNTLFANDAGLLHPEELIGKTDFEMGWREQAEIYRADDFAVMEAREPKLAFEEPQTTPDGQIIWLRTSKVPLLDDKDQVIGILGIYEDITSQKQTEDELQSIRRRHKQAQRIAHLGHWRLDLLNNELTWSEEAFRIFEIDQEQGIASYEAFLDAIHPDDRNMVNSAYQNSLNEQTNYDIEHRLLMKDGRIKWVNERCETSFSEDGSPIRSIGTILDITDRKVVELKLQESEKRFRDLFEKSPDPCWIINDENLFVSCNRAVAETLGYETVKALESTHPSQLSPEKQPDGTDSFEKANAMIKLAYQLGTHRFEWEHQKRDGELLPVEVTLASIDTDGKKQLYCTWHDITERKQVEKELRSSEERFKLAMAGANDGLWDWNLNTDEVYYSPRWFSMLGYEPSAFPPLLTTWADLVHPDDKQRVLEQVTDYLEGRSDSFEAEMRMQHKNGDHVTVLSRASKALDDDGKPVRLIGTHVDITDHKRSEAALKKEILFRSQLLDQATEGIVVWCAGDEENSAEFITWNRRMQEITGYTREEINRLGWLETIYHDPDERERARVTMQQVLDGEPNFGTDFNAVNKEGQHRILHISSSLIKNENDDKPCVLAVIQNVTASRVQQQLLDDERKRFRTLFESSTDGIFIINRDGEFIDINRTAYRRLGYTKDEMMALGIVGLDPPEYKARIPERIEQIKTIGSATFETAHYRKDGTVMPVEINARTLDLDGEQVFFSVVRDISDRKRAEQELQLAKFVMDHAPLNITFVDEDAHIHYLNKTGCETLGYSEAEALQLTIPDIDPLFPMESWREHWLDLKTKGQVVVETQHQRKNGESFPIEVIANYMEFGDKAYNVAFDRDITERQKIETALRESEAQFRNIIDASPVPYALNDEHQNITYLNPAFIKTFGYTLEDIPTLESWWPVAYPDTEYRQWVEKTWQHHLHQAMDSGRFEPIELNICCKDGMMRTAIVGASSLTEKKFEGIHLVTLFDITEHKQLEEQLRHSQKMEAIGTLVGGIAHDFNNMLAAMQGNIYLAKMQMRDHPVASDKLLNIEKLANKAADMVQQLLTFARKDNIAMQKFTLNSFMNEGFKLAKTLIPENIDHQTHICSEPLMIKGDATQLQQVLMNLLNNAVDAVFDRPQPMIRCSLSAYHADEKFLRRHSELKGEDFACISVADNGYGIKDDDIESIFEPFFTTKEVGKGTGLGLAMLYGAIQSHHGTVEVESVVESGTQFRIYLPVYQDEHKCHKESNQPVSASETVTILLADDDEGVRQTTSEVLSAMGHHLIEANNGEQALELYRSHQQEIGLIITDIIMPKGNGTDLFNAVRESDNQLPIILVTGYDSDQMLKTDRFSRIMNKPFDFDLLSHTIEVLLNEGK